MCYVYIVEQLCVFVSLHLTMCLVLNKERIYEFYDSVASILSYCPRGLPIFLLFCFVCLFVCLFVCHQIVKACSNGHDS